MIEYLTITEFIPDAKNKSVSMELSPLILGSTLNEKEKIQDFFGGHIENIETKTSKTKPGRFLKQTSTILSHIQSIFNYNEDYLNVEKKQFPFQDDLKDMTTSQENFYVLSHAISQEFKKSVGNRFRSPYLLVTLQWKRESSNILAIMKMEKYLGVQYTDTKELLVQLNMLPEKKRDLQKAALIYWDNIQRYPIKDFEYGNNDINAFHTKILDKQDENISATFMTKFLDNKIIVQDKENTRLLQEILPRELAKYTNDGIEEKEVKKNLDRILQRKEYINIDSLVESLLADENVFSPDKLNSAGQDAISLSNKVYAKMLDENPTAQKQFQAEPYLIERQTFKNDEGTIDIKIAQAIIDDGKVEITTVKENDEPWINIKIKESVL